MMRGVPDPSRSARAIARRGLWIVVYVASAILLILAGLSAANFTSIVRAKASVYFVAQFTVTFEGLDPDGRLTPDGSVRVRAMAVVENPSDRPLHLYLSAYSGWMRDGPAEAGLNESRRTTVDDLLIGPEGNMWFFRVFGQSTEITPESVPARSNRTFTFDFATSAISYASGFAAIRNITDFEIDRGGSAESVPWNHYLYLVLAIDGVPEATSPSAPAYLRDIRRIERESGVNIAR